MRKKAIGVLIVALFLLLAWMSLPAKAVQAKSLSGCTSWGTAASPNAGGGDNLNGVAAIAPNDVWAVGSYFNTSASTQQTLVEHWNGSAWSIFSSPNVGTQQNYLQGISALSATNVWAVGYYYSSTVNTQQTLIEHWDGSSWTVVSSPSPSNGMMVMLSSITARAVNDVWVVGSYFALNGIATQESLIEHWDGTNWSIVPSVNIGTSATSLTGVTATSSTDAWAVGTFANSGGLNQTLIEHWDGTSWSVASSPNPEAFDVLSAVEATSDTNAWAVGYSSPTNGDHTLIEHWNGSTWNVVGSPNTTNALDNVLSSLSIVSATNIWAVGEFDDGSSVTQTLIEHWNGTSWQVFASPTPTSYGLLTSVSRVPRTPLSVVCGLGILPLFKPGQ